MDNKFQLQIAFDHKLEAFGNILSIEDFDEKEVSKYCIGEKRNCVLDIYVKLVRNNRENTL